MSRAMLIVQKYGGTSVADADRIRNVARRALAARKDGHDVVVVVSAMAGETNRLIGLAREIQAQPDGQLFNTVSNGVRQMPGYGHQLKDVLDRWAIVAYVRELQFAYGNPHVK